SDHTLRDVDSEAGCSRGAGAGARPRSESRAGQHSNRAPKNLRAARQRPSLALPRHELPPVGGVGAEAHLSRWPPDLAADPVGATLALVALGAGRWCGIPARSTTRTHGGGLKLNQGP